MWFFMWFLIAFCFVVISYTSMSLCHYVFQILFPKNGSGLDESDESRESEQSDKNANKNALYEPLNKSRNKSFYQHAARRYPLYRGRS